MIPQIMQCILYYEFTERQNESTINLLSSSEIDASFAKERRKFFDLAVKQSAKKSVTIDENEFD